MRRSDKRKMSLPTKILLWVVGILFLLTVIAVIYVGAKIFITGDKIHNPLNRSHSELRSGKVNLKNGDPLQLLYLVWTLMQNVNSKVEVNVVIPS